MSCEQMDPSSHLDRRNPVCPAVDHGFVSDGGDPIHDATYRGSPGEVDDETLLAEQLMERT